MFVGRIGQQHFLWSWLHSASEKIRRYWTGEIGVYHDNFMIMFVL